MDWCDPDETQTDTKDYLNDVTEVTSKLTGVKFKNLPGNINYSTFPPGWTKLCNIHRGCVKLKLFSLASCFTGRVFTRELSGVDSQTATKSRKQLILFYFQSNILAYNNFIWTKKGQMIYVEIWMIETFYSLLISNLAVQTFTISYIKYSVNS